ncbi:carbon-nitrogen hydrolase family protein [Exilibacterium tricleocarpae]|uniref:Carbon-nitrogen hydrolase family protein n=1 Tax=Exilibacterium tricleocarpae TaxID=2591008 RepID=A0A545SXI0_9GAMM|nr:carbon-nitrogen hydrolase family protein [Exilibacterium tricleocarpae]TQV69670.1 carbon-nitrogen hydrolase family protein [Exilibacterium tricleocarpae]
MTLPNQLKIAFAQIAPVWLNREATTEKIIAAIEAAAHMDAQLVAFGEALLPGYPFWLSVTNGSEFNVKAQKQIHAHYLRNAVSIADGHLDPLCQTCRSLGIAAYVGCIENAADRGGKSLYCAMVYISADGEIGSVHRKLMPTYEERLTWSPGDGNGLRVHRVGPFTVGGLNCWENWMPLPRAALYAQGEDLHVAIWPGGEHNTHDITRFIAKESRSYVMSACGLMRREDFPEDTPNLDLILENPQAYYANGGSCVAAPNGDWVIEPVVGSEAIQVADIDHNLVLEERHNFDPSGHYSRPDVTRLTVSRERQAVVKFLD